MGGYAGTYVVGLLSGIMLAAYLLPSGNPKPRIEYATSGGRVTEVTVIAPGRVIKGTGYNVEEIFGRACYEQCLETNGCLVKQPSR